MRRVLAVLLVLGSTLGLAACRRPPSRGRVLALGLAVFSKDAAGKQVPGQATAGFLAPGGKTWRHGTLTRPREQRLPQAARVLPAARRLRPAERGGHRGRAQAVAAGHRTRRCSGRPTSGAASRGSATPRSPTSSATASRRSWWPPTTRASSPSSGPTARAATPRRSSTASRTPSCTRSRWATSTATASARSTRRRASRTGSTARRSPARSCATCPRAARGARCSPISATATPRRSWSRTWTGTARTSSTPPSRR